jgi:NitT/TauT family transport system substrate-binding protein
VEGILVGNGMLLTDSKPHLETIAKAFGWTADKATKELSKVHLANLPENLAFFSGTVDSAGSYGYIYESAVMAYGAEFVRDSRHSEKFLDLAHIKALDQEGKFKDQKADIKPIRERPDLQSEEPLLAKNVRFLFQPNSNKLDLNNKGNLGDLDRISKMLQVSPGSTLTLRGHTDTSMVAAFRKQGGEKLVREMALRAIQLSKERCDEVRTILIENYKVDPKRIDTVGCGWAEPLGDDQQQNRRVEVQWFTVM